MAARDWPRARALLERVLELEPNAGRVAYKLGQVHRRLGNLDRARQWLERRSEVAPGIEDPLLLEVATSQHESEVLHESRRAGVAAW